MPQCFQSVFLWSIVNYVFGTVSHWCLVHNSTRSIFSPQEVIVKSILHTFRQPYCRNAADAASCCCCYFDDTLLRHIVCPRFMLGAVFSALTGDLAILLFASEGHSPSSVCSWAWICSWGALWMCDRLPRRGVIPKGSRSNRVIYYTVQLFLPPPLLPPPLPFCQCLGISLPLPLHQHFRRTNEK